LPRLHVALGHGKLEPDALVWDHAAHLHLAVAEAAVLALKGHENNLRAARSELSRCQRALRGRLWRASRKNGILVISIVVVPCAGDQPLCSGRAGAAEGCARPRTFFMQFVHRLSSRSGSAFGFNVMYSVGGWLAAGACGSASPSLIAASSSRVRLPVADVAAAFQGRGRACQQGSGTWSARVWRSLSPEFAPTHSRPPLIV